MSGRFYRPCPYNGSGDSPRPPLLTEFVNQISKIALAELVYHLFGRQLGMRVHAHIERTVRLKTESSVGVVKLHRTDAQIGKYAVRAAGGHAFRHLGVG